MAIVVKGMYMPSSCAKCPFMIYKKDEDWEGHVCVATDPFRLSCEEPVELPLAKGRSSFCPLRTLDDFHI